MITCQMRLLGSLDIRFSVTSVHGLTWTSGVALGLATLSTKIMHLSGVSNETNLFFQNLGIQRGVQALLLAWGVNERHVYQKVHPHSSGGAHHLALQPKVIRTALNFKTSEKAGRPIVVNGRPDGRHSSSS